MDVPRYDDENEEKRSAGILWPVRGMFDDVRFERLSIDDVRTFRDEVYESFETKRKNPSMNDSEKSSHDLYRPVRTITDDPDADGFWTWDTVREVWKFHETKRPFIAPGSSPRLIRSNELACGTTIYEKKKFDKIVARETEMFPNAVEKVFRPGAGFKGMSHSNVSWRRPEYARLDMGKFYCTQYALRKFFLEDESPEEELECGDYNDTDHLAMFLSSLKRREKIGLFGDPGDVLVFMEFLATYYDTRIRAEPVNDQLPVQLIVNDKFSPPVIKNDAAVVYTNRCVGKTEKFGGMRLGDTVFHIRENKDLGDLDMSHVVYVFNEPEIQKCVKKMESLFDEDKHPWNCDERVTNDHWRVPAFANIETAEEWLFRRFGKNIYMPTLKDINEDYGFDTEIYIPHDAWKITLRNEEHGFDHPDAPKWMMYLKDGKLLWKRNPYYKL
jgi:hypothetical protein